MAENNPFEIPQQVRELAEKNIEQARQFYDQWMEGVSQVMNLWSASPAGGMAPGFDSLRERAIKFAQENAEAAFALADELQRETTFDDASKPLRASPSEILCRPNARTRPIDDSGLTKHEDFQLSS
jgi:hypothetical protein